METTTEHRDESTLDSPVSVAREAEWQRNVRWARWLAWVSLAVLLTEGAVGLWQGIAVGSVALTGWALGGGSEGLASAMVLWRFTGDRTWSATAEHRAQRGVAVSFWLTAPYLVAESIRHLAGEHRAETSVIGIGLTAIALLLMPVLGWANHRVGERLGSGPLRARAPRTTCVLLRPPRFCLGWRSLPCGRTAGGLTPRSGWPSPVSRSGRASAPGVVTAAAASGPGGSGSTGNCWPPPPPTTRCAGSPPAPARAHRPRRSAARPR